MEQNKTLTLADLRVGERAQVYGISAACPIHRRFLDLGLVPGVSVVCMGKSPLGDPFCYLIRGKHVAIRRRDARWVFIY